MQLIKNKKIILYIGLAAIVLSGIKTLLPLRDCDKIKHIAEDESVQSYLINWVDQNVVGKDFDEIGEFRHGSPSIFVMPEAHVNWLRLSFSPLLAEVRLIVDLEMNPIAVYFGQDSRHGILVSPNGEFGDLDPLVVNNSRNVAVYCAESITLPVPE